MNDKSQIETLEQGFKKLMQQLLNESFKSADLDKAMGDFAGAEKEQIKIAVLQDNLARFDEAKTEETLDKLSEVFLAALESQKQVYEDAISVAKANGDKEDLIRQQIRLSVINGPVAGLFHRYYSQAEKASQS